MQVHWVLGAGVLREMTLFDDARRFVRWILQSVYGTEPVSFIAHGSPEQAARTLAASTPRRRQFRFLEEFVGSVSPTQVVVRRRRPSVHSTYAPLFRGQFVTHGGRTHLEGRFQLDLTTRVFLTIWFGMVALWCVGVIVVTFIAVVQHPASSWRSLLFCAGFLALGIALMTLVAWLAGPSTTMWKFEVERISTHIRQALKKGRES